MAMAQPTFDTEGYPTDATLEIISTWPFPFDGLMESCAQRGSTPTRATGSRRVPVTNSRPAGGAATNPSSQHCTRTTSSGYCPGRIAGGADTALSTSRGKTD